MTMFYTDSLRLQGIANALRTAARLTKCVRQAQTREERTRHARHARLFIADARRLSRRITGVSIDKGARAGVIRTMPHYAADRSIEAASLWLDRAVARARAAEVSP